MNDVNTKRFLTVREVVRTGLIGEHYLRRRIAQRQIPGIYSGNRFLVNYAALVELLERESKEAMQG